MLTESKITIILSVITGNTVIGVFGNELLKIYLLGRNSSEEISASDNSIFLKTTVSRIKTNAVSFDPKTKSNFDPRIYKDVNPTTVDKNPAKYTVYSFHQISQYKGKFVDWKENKEWWEKTYEKRKYVLENANFEKYVNIVGGYKNQQYWQASELHMNQFCDYGYSNNSYFREHEEQFWLLCTTDAKNPKDKENTQTISQINKAKFNKGETEEEIIYLTVEQAKKTNIYNATTNNAKDKFVVYDYSPEWWEWSFNYRWKVDKNSEVSSFPLSDKFKNATTGWSKETNEKASLNLICQDFYESKNMPSQNEIDDAWRYCTDAGKQ
ncbi:hypothetical protein MHSWG343_05940 [Candidatus Mycoplasma haematohominis]|uniref:Uncharacterized protein n=1 Tax=Candidatus Mycoplasma haematohominis TaxID=1494318 RepID=A0A478FR27_9MOLU|nr:hypothetical protein MHSWG343_05940 [Candidatus Mycoplasma haemohominis]